MIKLYYCNSNRALYMLLSNGRAYKNHADDLSNRWTRSDFNAQDLHTMYYDHRKLFAYVGSL